MIAFFWIVIDFLQSYGAAVTAIATVFIAIFTIVLAIVTNRQARLTRKSIDLARDEFLASHRPKIIVHSIEFRRIPGEEEVARIGASILCFNEGRTLALNVEARGEILSTANLEFDVQRALIKTFPEVASGKKLRFEVKSDYPLRDLVHREQQKLPPMYCVGTVAYIDQNKTRRETGFCFFVVVDAHGERWKSAKSPEHEYAY
jgi:hypothetical protein